MISSLNVGQQAPDFKLQNQNEEWVSLKDLLSGGPLLIVFYPGDFTPVCTRQLCNYRDAYDDFVRFDVRIVGISPNSPEEHQRFKSRYQFAFDLLSDPDKKITREYGVTSLFMLGGTSRAVYVVSRGGRVLYRYVEPTSLTRRKSDELIEILGKLRSTQSL